MCSTERQHRRGSFNACRAEKPLTSASVLQFCRDPVHSTFSPALFASVRTSSLCRNACLHQPSPALPAAGSRFYSMAKANQLRLGQWVQDSPAAPEPAGVYLRQRAEARQMVCLAAVRFCHVTGRALPFASLFTDRGLPSHLVKAAQACPRLTPDIPSMALSLARGSQASSALIAAAPLPGQHSLTGSGVPCTAVHVARLARCAIRTSAPAKLRMLQATQDIPGGPGPLALVWWLTTPCLAAPEGDAGLISPWPAYDVQLLQARYSPALHGSS